jgi:hypothetical protein
LIVTFIAETRKQSERRANVRQMRNALIRARLDRQKRGDQDRQRRVFRAAHRHFSCQGFAALNDNRIHEHLA